MSCKNWSTIYSEYYEESLRPEDWRTHLLRKNIEAESPIRSGTRLKCGEDLSRLLFLHVCSKSWNKNLDKLFNSDWLLTQFWLKSDIHTARWGRFFNNVLVCGLAKFWSWFIQFICSVSRVATNHCVAIFDATIEICDAWMLDKQCTYFSDGMSCSTSFYAFMVMFRNFHH